MPRIADIAHLLEAIAPPALQEDYDNSGLLVGEPSTEVTGVLVSLDVTEEVVAFPSSSRVVVASIRVP